METHTMETDTKTASTTAPSQGLTELESTLRRELALIDYPKRDWVLPHETSDGKKILDVLIIGAGQGGLAVASGLMREKVFNIQVIDQNPEDHEGPWRTFARMITLRTPKYLTGPDMDIPNLTFQAWYEAQYGADAWEQVGLIPKNLWADYLHWYRTFLQIPVKNESQAGAIEWLASENCYTVPITCQGETTTCYARKVVLATGIDGSGRWEVPSFIQDNIPKSFYAHTREDIDFESLKGKRVGVLGAGASAFDNASVALETGASEIHLFFRREKLVDINAYRWAEFTGFLKHHADLPDEDKWRFILQILRMGQLPPADTLERAQRHDDFHLHSGSPWDNVQQVDDHVRVTTPRGTYDLDFLIIGTGFVTDLSLRPELSKVYPEIALWSDRYTPPESDQHADLMRHPYLGSAFQFTEKNPGNASYLSGIFNYTFGCLPSLGFGGASISGMKYSLPKIVGGLTRQLFVDDRAAYYETLMSYDAKEF